MKKIVSRLLVIATTAFIANAACADAFLFRHRGSFEIPNQSGFQNKIDDEFGVPLSITGSPSSYAVAGKSYSAQFTASGGKGARSFHPATGALPAWLALNASTGVLSGTPSTSDVGTTQQIAIGVTDQSKTVATDSFVIAVAPPLSVSGISPVIATSGQSYAASLTAAGGIAPYTWSLDGDPLPGVTINNSGIISGTVSAPSGTFNFSAVVTDADGNTASRPITVSVQNVIILTSNQTLTIPSYSKITIECWGGGGPGGALSTVAYNTYPTSGQTAGGISEIKTGTQVYCRANGGLPGSGVYRTATAAPGTAGMVGNTTLNGGSQGSQGIKIGTVPTWALGGAGGSAMNGGMGGQNSTYPPSGQGADGADGQSPGGGGAGATMAWPTNIDASGANGGSSGAYAKSVFTTASSGRPIPGSSFTAVVGAGGTRVSGSSGVRPGGFAGRGEIKITIE